MDLKRSISNVSILAFSLVLGLFNTLHLHAEEAALPVSAVVPSLPSTVPNSAEILAFADGLPQALADLEAYEASVIGAFNAYGDSLALIAADAESERGSPLPRRSPGLIPKS